MTEAATEVDELTTKKKEYQYTSEKTPHMTTDLIREVKYWYQFYYGLFILIK